MRTYLLGNHTIAKGLIDAGVSLVSGYPGTPSSEIIEEVIKLDDEGDARIHVEWSSNEKVALEVAIGAAWCGTRAACTMKHVGLNASADPFMTLSYTGTRGGLVLIVADDPYAHSSQNEQDTRRYAMFAKVPCLEPADPQEAYDLTLEAFSLSERLETPVVLKSSTRVSHAKQDVELDGEAMIEKMPSKGAKFEKMPSRFVMVPANARTAHKKLEMKWSELVRKGSGHSFIEWGDNEWGIAASGVARLYVKEALLRLGLSPTILHVRSYPVGEGLVREILHSCNHILVVEELEPVVEEILLTEKAIDGGGEVMGKHDGILEPCGELSVDSVQQAIITFLKRISIPLPVSLPSLPHEVDSTEDDILLPSRPPVMCPGCGHRVTFYEMLEVFGEDAVFPSDIGCYTLGVSMGAVDTTLCMGASITIASGISQVSDQPVCCTIGDSTFVHSGIPGLINAVYNKANITVTILDNRTTAMTGHQPHPAIGRNAREEVAP
ncbi:MAG: thiamine pyrophosphate-dependent enzyme [Methermicoccaceae archaeon]